MHNNKTNNDFSNIIIKSIKYTSKIILNIIKYSSTII